VSAYRGTAIAETRYAVDYYTDDSKHEHLLQIVQHASWCVPIMVPRGLFSTSITVLERSF